jgi:nucleotidyltransferase/DNA polymerase involved in DNA repair
MDGVVYVDMDAFYVSCERLRHPELSGRPVAVSADPRGGQGRGVVLSASYEARDFGLRSAMPVSRAFALCPQAVYLRPDFLFYEAMSRRVMDLLKERSPQARAFSIDEAGYPARFEGRAGAEREGRAVQEEIRQRLQLPSSVGIAPNLTLAKMASDRAKPGGVVVVLPEEVPSFLSPLPVRSVPGVGPVTEQALRSHGVQTIAQLLTLPPRDRKALLGSADPSIVRMARGERLDSPWPEEEGPRSVGSMSTFEVDTEDAEVLSREVQTLAGRVSDELRRRGLRFRTVTLRVRYEDFSQVQRSQTLPRPTEGSDTLRRLGEGLLKELLRERRGSPAPLGPVPARQPPRRVRTLSLTVQGLRGVPAGERPLEGFLPGRPDPGGPPDREA